MSNVEVHGRANGCARCDQQFATISQFDTHQIVTYDEPDAVRCRKPEGMGLVQDEYGVWQTPEGLVFRKRTQEMMRGFNAK